MGKIKLVKPSQLNMKGSYKFEQWKDLENFENGKYKGLYKVSTFGRVYSVENRKVLKPRAVGKGYLQVTLCKNGKHQQCYIHRLVATEFIPDPENKNSVDHINNIKKDNRVENLRWATLQENQNNEITLANRTNGRYIIIPYCILDDGTKLGLAVYKGLSQAEREVQSYSVGVTNSNIQMVLNPKRYNKSCGKIKATANTPDITLAKIAIHNLEGKKIYWTYLQDWGEFDLEKYLASNGIILNIGA